MYNIIDIHKQFNNEKVLDGINIDIHSNKIVSIIGPSGCGKTTLLNIIAGIVKPDEGDIDGLSNKNISYLFQDLRLLEWKSVYDNLAFVLNGKVDKAQINSIIENYLNQVELLQYKDYMPSELSGGMRQRVSLARAFAYPSQVLVMDEPFKSLDLELRINVINNFKKMWLKDKRTVIFVTHDIKSAVMLGDYIYLLTKKPTKVKKVYKNDINFNERNYSNEKVSLLETKIYNDFIVNLTI